MIPSSHNNPEGDRSLTILFYRQEDQDSERSDTSKWLSVGKNPVRLTSNDVLSILHREPHGREDSRGEKAIPGFQIPPPSPGMDVYSTSGRTELCSVQENDQPEESDDQMPY